MEEYRAAIDAGDPGRVRSLIKRGIKAYPLAILRAVLKDQRHLIPLLKEAGADPNACDAFYTVALGQAVKFKSPEMVEILLKIGADPNQEDGAVLPLVSAASNGKIRQVNLLLNYGVDVNRVMWNGLTAILQAVRNGYLDVVKTLMEAGANPRHKGPDGKNCFDLAKESGREDILNVLEQLPKRMPKAPDRKTKSKGPKTKSARLLSVGGTVAPTVKCKRGEQARLCEAAIV